MSVPGVSSRRFACDLCRGQKLRCFREQADQQSCDRCFRADAECRTSPVFRVRSYVSDKALANTDSIGEKERPQKRVRMRQYNAPQPQGQSQVVTLQNSRDIDAAIVTETMQLPISLEQTTFMSFFEMCPSPSAVPMYSMDISTLDRTRDMH